MLKTIIQASQKFCTHQMREEPLFHDNLSKEKVLITYIDIDTHDKQKHRVYIATCSKFMQKISKIFLEEEEESDVETLIDMALETTNLIVGSAKVIAEQENHNSYTINTPHFKKYDIFDFEYDELKLLSIGKDTLILAIKELN